MTNYQIFIDTLRDSFNAEKVKRAEIMNQKKFYSYFTIKSDIFINARENQAILKFGIFNNNMKIIKDTKSEVKFSCIELLANFDILSQEKQKYLAWAERKINNIKKELDLKTKGAFFDKMKKTGLSKKQKNELWVNDILSKINE